MARRCNNAGGNIAVLGLLSALQSALVIRGERGASKDDDLKLERYRTISNDDLPPEQKIGGPDTAHRMDAQHVEWCRTGAMDEGTDHCVRNGAQLNSLSKSLGSRGAGTMCCSRTEPGR